MSASPYRGSYPTEWVGAPLIRLNGKISPEINRSFNGWLIREDKVRLQFRYLGAYR